MKSFVRRIGVVLLLCFISWALLAQEKTQAYYNSHENELLPDARSAFQEGNYDRTVLLCNWYYIFTGDHAADSLRERAERCSQLSSDMADFRSAGKTNEAKEAAKTLLSINPNDTAAKQLIEELEEPVLPLPVDTIVVDSPLVMDTVVTEVPILDEEPIEEPIQEPTRVVDEKQKDESVRDTPSHLRESTSPRTMFVLKGGASILNLNQIAQCVAPGGSLGIYNLGGSSIGLEAGGYLCSNLLSSGSIFGLDGALVFRIAKSVYPKVGLGYFSYTDNSDSGSATHGLCAGGGLTFLLGGHFCLEVGAKYYPEVRIQSIETVSTTPGSTYDFPSVRQILPGGIAPFASIGWAF